MLHDAVLPVIEKESSIISPWSNDDDDTPREVVSELELELEVVYGGGGESPDEGVTTANSCSSNETWLLVSSSIFVAGLGLDPWSFKLLEQTTNKVVAYYPN